MASVAVQEITGDVSSPRWSPFPFSFTTTGRTQRPPELCPSSRLCGKSLLSQRVTVTSFSVVSLPSLLAPLSPPAPCPLSPFHPSSPPPSILAAFRRQWNISVTLRQPFGRAHTLPLSVFLRAEPSAFPQSC